MKEKTTPNMPEVIIIGGNHHNTLAILRSLGERGISSNLIVITGDKKPFTTYSKYVKRCVVLQSYDGIKEAMYKIKVGSDKPVVIACSDRVSSYLDENKNDLCPFFLLPGAKIQGRITHLMNKDTMAMLATECGICVPKSWVKETRNAEVDEVEYPCIVKPLASIVGSKSDIFICSNKQELTDCLSKIKSARVQIQKYIEKDFEFQLIGCSLNGGETVIIPGASIILRQPKNTNTGFLKYVPKRDFKFEENLCRSFLKATQYSGLFSMEFLRGKDGKDYFMEINFRNDGNSICVTASGMNLPYIWYLYNCGLPYTEELCYDKMKEVLVMPEFEDFHNVRTRQISIFHWLKDVKRTDRFMEFSKHDQRPFWAKLKTLIFIHLGLEKSVEMN